MVKILNEKDKGALMAQAEELEKVLEHGVMNENTIIKVRYFELACKIALISEELS